MKNILLLLFALFCFQASAQVKHKCLYVISEQAGIFKEPSLKKLYHQLRLGDLVRVEENTGKTGKAVLDGKKVKFEWLKVSFKNNPANADEEKITGYIPSVYLNPYLKKLPMQLIKDYNFISLENGDRIDINQTDYNFYYNQGYDRPVDSTNCGCYAYYEHMTGLMYSYADGSIERFTDRGDSRLDTLKYFIDIEEVDTSSIKNKVNSPYEVDESINADTIPTVIRWLEVQDDIDTKLIRRFYIYINNGKDSVLINERDYEYGSAERFAGQIIPYNKYLLCWESFFYNGYSLIDKTTGKKTAFTSGKPFISPSGKFVVDYYESVDYEAERAYGAIVTVSSIGDSLQLTPHIIVGFRSFVPVGDAFWVSDTELVMAIIPLDNDIYRMCGYKTETDSNSI
jgi:hypothetical protein